MIDSVARLHHRNAPEQNRLVLDQIPWAHGTPRLLALGYDFAVRATSEALGAYLEQLLASFTSPGPEPLHLYSFIDEPDRPDERYVIYRDGEHVVTTAYASTALRHLLWDINRRVVEETPNLLLLHASAAEHRGRAVIFPAEMDSGKTTLVAGLVRAGLRYLTDETVAIDGETLAVHPYPKPLSLDPGSWKVLPDLRPDLDPELEPFARGQWHVDPGSIRADAVAPPVEVGFVIVPRYERGGGTELVPMPREEALLLLASSSFNIDRFGSERGLQVMAAVVRRSACYRLTIDDLDVACELILTAVDAQPTDARR